LQSFPFSFFSLQTVWAFTIRLGTGAAVALAGVFAVFVSVVAMLGLAF